MAAPFGCFCPPECPIPFPVSFALLNLQVCPALPPRVCSTPLLSCCKNATLWLQCQHGLCGRAAASPCGSIQQHQTASSCGWSGSEYGLDLRVPWMGRKGEYSKGKHCLFLVSVFSLKRETVLPRKCGFVSDL